METSDITLSIAVPIRNSGVRMRTLGCSSHTKRVQLDAGANREPIRHWRPTGSLPFALGMGMVGENRSFFYIDL